MSDATSQLSPLPRRRHDAVTPHRSRQDAFTPTRGRFRVQPIPPEIFYASTPKLPLRSEQVAVDDTLARWKDGAQLEIEELRTAGATNLLTPSQAQFCRETFLMHTQTSEYEVIPAKLPQKPHRKHREVGARKKARMQS